MATKKQPIEKKQTAAKKKPVLKGRGLESILGNIDVDSMQSKSTVAAVITEIALSDIETNPYQPRKEFSEESLDELSQSIKQQGVITPVTVRKMPDGKYQLIAGERRLRASKKAGLEKLPAYVRVATDSQMMEMALVENIQRENLNAIEVALSYNALVEECNLTHEQLSERLGKSRATITNYLRLLNLPAETQLALSQDKISMAHARAMVNVEDPELHLQILHDIISKNLSVRETEQLVKQGKKTPAVKKVQVSTLPPAYSQARTQLKNTLKSEVEIKRNRKGKGSVTIFFNNDSDFDRLVKLLEK